MEQTEDSRHLRNISIDWERNSQSFLFANHIKKADLLLNDDICDSLTSGLDNNEEIVALDNMRSNNFLD
jgi:hypothetical protein